MSRPSLQLRELAACRGYEVRWTLADIDEIEGQLGKAQALTAKHRARLAGQCDSAAASGKMPGGHQGSNGRAGTVNGSGNPERKQANQ